MNPAYYFDLPTVRRAVVIPTVVCLWYLVRLSWKGELYGVQQRMFVLWFFAALVTEFASRTVWGWIAGFLGQVALAIVLVLKSQWEDIEFRWRKS
jgi:phosphotransferase system  glucose/maltose/N-acetylglucosamine-specific IIC component